MKENQGNATKLTKEEVKALLTHLRVLQFKGIPLTRVAWKTGVARASLLAWRAGEYQPSVRLAKKIYEIFPGDPEDL